jgi:hypothetical protein
MADISPKSDQRKSWRDVIKIHPAAELFPLMSEQELLELGGDIKKNGLKSPIVLTWPGLGHLGDPSSYMLLDGRNRLDAMERVGIPFELVFAKPMPRSRSDPCWLLRDILGEDDDYDGVLWEGSPIRLESSDPYEFVLSANVHRRHLTPEQKRELIAKLIKAEPERSNRQIATEIGASHPFVGKIRDELEQKGDVETVSTSIDTKGRRQPARKSGHIVTKGLPRPNPEKARDTWRTDLQPELTSSSSVPAERALHLAAGARAPSLARAPSSADDDDDFLRSESELSELAHIVLELSDTAEAAARLLLSALFELGADPTDVARRLRQDPPSLDEPLRAWLVALAAALSEEAAR